MQCSAKPVSQDRYASIVTHSDSRRAKNGNQYLAWAFFEAAHFAIQYLPAAKRFYEKKAAQRHPIPWRPPDFPRVWPVETPPPLR
jgi:hypothetical protein